MSGVVRRVVALLLAVLAASPTQAAEDEAAASVFLERVGVPEVAYPGQVLAVTLRLGVDRERFDAHAAPLFRQPTDLPVQVSGLGAVDGLEALEGEDEARFERATLVKDGAVVAAVKGPTVTREGRSYETYALHRRWIVTAAQGAITLPAPTLRLAWAERFEEDFLGDRVPLDPRFVTVRGAAQRIEVRPLPPPPSRPPFLGAVGRLSLEAQVDREAVEVGERFLLTLRLRADLAPPTDLARFEAPRLDALTGYHVYGMQDDRGHPLRTIRYELAAKRAGLRSVPPLSFCAFDPFAEPPAYVTLRSEALPLHVAGGEAAPGLEDATPPQAPCGVPETPEEDDSLVLWLVVMLGFAVGVVLGLRVRRARGAKATAASGAEPRAETLRGLAGAALEAALAREPGREPRLDRLLAAWLATHMGCSTAAVLAPGLAARLEAAGAPPAAARDGERVLERLVATRYGAPALGRADLERTRAAVAALRAVFAQRTA